jgi:hypothetical protein
LFRKVCTKCHLINDAESDFCQSCGAALPALPFAPPVPNGPPPHERPDLTDAAYLEADEPRHLVSSPPQSDSGPIVAAPPRMPALPAHTVHAMRKAAASAHRTPILLGVGGAAVMLFAALLWPRGELPGAPSDDAPARGPSSNSAGQGAVAVDATRAVTDGAGPAAEPPSASSDVSQHEAAAASLPPMSGDANQPDRSPARRTPADWILAAHPPASGPAKKPTPASEAVRVPAMQPRPRPAAPRECTPQVDALGLCEAGARVTGR